MFTGALFEPAYRPMASGDWVLHLAPALLAPGYWSPPRLIQNVALLTRHAATWMSMTPMEMESQEIGIRCASGHVVIFGLGMGWAAAATAALPSVTQVTVVEVEPDVIALNQALGVFDPLPGEAREKLRIIQGDATRYIPDAPVDLLMADIWLPLVGGDRIAQVQDMQRNVSAQAIYFWGQEMEIARHAVRAGREIDDAGIAQTVAAFALPLAGTDTPNYATRTREAAQRWMRDRWLP